MMKQKLIARPARALIVVLLGMLVGVGVVVAGVSIHAHAAPAATQTVTDCTGETGPGQIGTVISSASAGDTINFSCSGTIPITSTLTIVTNNLTLDGSGQSVTLDGGNSVQVLFVNSGVLFTLNDLTVAHGFATINGGGLVNDGTLTISNSTFTNNSAERGALFNFNSTLNISNSTFANNIGGGLFNFGGAVSISNSTFANNIGLGLNNFGALKIGGSIVANNTGDNCSTPPGDPLGDQGYNLDSGDNNTCGFSTTNHDLVNTDPQLGPLANNGGSTQTMALTSTSPAIDQIPVTNQPPAASCPTTDQRGFLRPDDNEQFCDIGAYESGAKPDSDLALTNVPSDITVDATSPAGAVVTYTLPTAIDESGDSPGPSVSCTPASGSTFAIGTTIVTCTATDSDDTNSPVSASFKVTVNGAATQVSNLISLVNSFHLPAGIQQSFDSQLQAVLADLQANDTAQACSDLTSFINHVKAQSGKALTVSQANQLIAAATNSKKVLGCS